MILDQPPSLLPLVHRALAERLRAFVEAGVVAAEDAFAVDLLARRADEADVEALLGLVLAARGPRVGQVGVRLRSIAAELIDERGERGRSSGDDEPLALPADAVAWEQKVLGSALCGTEAEGRVFVGQPLADGSALVMPAAMAALQREVADRLTALAGATPTPTIDEASVREALLRLFPQEPDGEGAGAVATAARRALTIVTGGPGTGKTYSVTRTLALLLGHDPDGLRIALAAPTGKAAVRMREAIAENLSGASAPDTTPRVRERIDALQATTLHRLLGVRPDGTARHGSNNPLAYDVVVVDEVSMVDLALMRTLLAAIPAGARLILLGDRDQLASVEAGTVLGDIVRAGASASNALSASVVRFTRSRRFASAPTIAHIAANLQRASAADDGSETQRSEIERAERLLCADARVDTDDDPERVRWLDRELEVEDRALQHERLLDHLAAPYRPVFRPIADALEAGAVSALAEDATIVEVLLGLERYRVLATHRRGPRGVSGLQRGIEARVLRQLARTGAAIPNQAGHWLGRPLLVTQNDPATGLMNGDVGMVLPAGPDGQLVAVFLDREQGAPRPRTIALGRLPRHESALAMTVHKSQGSQFREVGLVLHDADSPIQTRELVYTGLTRAAERLRWSGPRPVLRRALGRRVARASGLVKWLAGGQ
ncbi:MAG: exodeoxyribonuclease V subunit alpha [Deltaproteobacteria bacterium]|nr:exodeoxyribonuclease V subunit alpha [Deltaproteobacteria bacterium]